MNVACNLNKTARITLNVCARNLVN